MVKTYPVGTKIKYVGYCNKCKGQIGKVIGMWDRGYNIILPQTLCKGVRSGGTFSCTWSEIIRVSVKNEQLVFAFME